LPNCDYHETDTVFEFYSKFENVCVSKTCTTNAYDKDALTSFKLTQPVKTF